MEEREASNHNTALVHEIRLYGKEAFEFTLTIRDSLLMLHKFNPARRHHIPRARYAVKN